MPCKHLSPLFDCSNCTKGTHKVRLHCNIKIYLWGASQRKLGKSLKPHLAKHKKQELKGTRKKETNETTALKAHIITPLM
jgi:hypothetical protein